MYEGRLSQYTKVRPIPLGGMTELFVALNPHGERVVVRCMKEEFRQKKAFVRQFLHGGEILQELSQQNIVRLLELDKNRDYPFMVLEYLEAANLRDLMTEDAAILRDQPLALIRQMIEAVHYLHSHDILHLDIKPENMVIDPHGHLTLLDFDLAVRRGGKPVRIGDISGTPAYIAPEVFKTHRVDVSSDIFSLGITMYELLARRKPYSTIKNTRHFLHKADAEPAAQLQQVAEGVSQALQSIIVKCLDIDPAARYPSISLVLKDIRAIA